MIIAPRRFYRKRPSGNQGIIISSAHWCGCRICRRGGGRSIDWARYGAGENNLHITEQFDSGLSSSDQWPSIDTRLQVINSSEEQINEPPAEGAYQITTPVRCGILPVWLRSCIDNDWCLKKRCSQITARIPYLSFLKVIPSLCALSPRRRLRCHRCHYGSGSQHKHFSNMCHQAGSGDGLNALNASPYHLAYEFNNPIVDGQRCGTWMPMRMAKRMVRNLATLADLGLLAPTSYRRGG